MKSFLHILWFELKNYLENKAFISVTLFFVLLFVIGLSVPAFVPSLLNRTQNKEMPKENMTEEREEANGTEENFLGNRYILWDKEGIIKDVALLEADMPAIWQVAESEEEVKEKVADGTVNAGFALLSNREYRYYVKTSSLMDRKKNTFEIALSNLLRREYLEERGLLEEEIESLFKTSFSSETIALLKDGAGNYFYVYILLFVLYMMILLYGQMIATSVTTEKSSRTMEILVTSTSTNNLLFGKVLAGSIASFFQVGVMLLAAVGTYAIQREAWHGMLDFIFQIPGSVLFSFAIFGVLGYIFYSFLYGILGALISKTEDLGKVSTPLTLVFVLVFLATIYSLGYSDSIWMKFMSFFPFSASNAMVARIALGSVTGIEIALSLVLLVLSILLAGFAGARIYRRATLMYGNPIKLTKAFQWIKKEE